MRLPLIIVGAGGHAAVVADALLAAGEHVLGCTDPDRARHGTVVCGLPVLGDDDAVLEFRAPDSVRLVNGIGGVRHTAARFAAQRRLEQRGWRFTLVRHPTAVVSRFARIAESAQLMAGCIVQAGADVGDGCIVNTAAVVEHDVQLGAWCHVAPRALLCGSVSVGARSHIGAGAVVIQGLQLGDDTVVGAGAVVIRDFGGQGVLVGAPARQVRDEK